MGKRNILSISFLGLLVFIFSVYISVNGLCEYKYICSRLHDDSFMAIFLVFLPFFLFSLITYKMKDNIFQTWFKFARIWVPLTILLVILSPEYGNSLLPVEKGTVSFFMSALFLIISLIIIAYKSFQNSKFSS